MIAIGHPLQSILQPRGGTGGVKAGALQGLGIPGVEKKLS